MWFHIDGCYGGLAAGLKEKAGLYEGLRRANSIALDFHKWLYQPFEIGCTLIKDASALKKAYRKIFQSDKTISEAVQEAGLEVNQVPEVGHLVKFIQDSERGVTT